MRIAYVDSSCLIAVALQEEGSGDLLFRLSRFDRLVASPLAEAEFRSALSRAQISLKPRRGDHQPPPVRGPGHG